MSRWEHPSPLNRRYVREPEGGEKTVPKEVDDSGQKVKRLLGPDGKTLAVVSNRPPLGFSHPSQEWRDA